MSKTTVQRWIVDLTIRVHCNSLKPVLTEENKVARLIMALESRDEEFREAIQDQELNAGLYTQAANSPDVNLLDLGFF